MRSELDFQSLKFLNSRILNPTLHKSSQRTRLVWQDEIAAEMSGRQPSSVLFRFQSLARVFSSIQGLAGKFSGEGFPGLTELEWKRQPARPTAQTLHWLV